MKKINVFCVLVLALMLIDMVPLAFYCSHFSSHWWHLVLSWWLWSVSSSLS